MQYAIEQHEAGSLRRRPDQQRGVTQWRREPTVERGGRRKEEIQRICCERGVATLIHFTKLHNVASILREGLLPRDELEVRHFHPATFNDLHRWDNFKNAVCLSISFPNYQMFYSHRWRGDDAWAVIELNAAILWEIPCAFCIDNAASTNMRRASLQSRRDGA